MPTTEVNLCRRGSSGGGATLRWSTDPRDTTTRAAGSLARIALLFGGWHRGAFELEVVGQRLLQPLHGPDVLLALTFRDGDGCDSVESCRLTERFEPLRRHGSGVVRVELERQLETHEFLALLEALPHWPVLEAAYNSSGGCRRSTNGRVASYRCNHIKENGNSYMAPVFGNPGLHVLHELRAQSRLLQMLYASEAIRGGGVAGGKGGSGGSGGSSGGEAHRYSHVVWSRLDFMWLASHPPLRLLSGCGMWAPLAEDSGGLNDRHAVMSRAVAPLYLSRYDAILDGSLLRVQPTFRQTPPVLSGQSSERYLATLLYYHNVTVCRFPIFSFLQCCTAAGADVRKQCNHKQCHPIANHGAMRAAGTAELAAHLLLNGSVSRGIGGKYGGEMTAALDAATASLVEGARFELVPNLRFTCEGAQTAQLRKGPALTIALPRQAHASVACNRGCKCTSLIKASS